MCLCRITASAEEVDPLGTDDRRVTLWAVAAAVVLIALAIWLCVKKRKNKKASMPRNKVAGLSDKKYLRSYCKRIGSDGTNRCVAYIAFDAKSAAERFSKESCGDTIEYASKLLAGILDENDCAASVGDGEFAMYFEYSDIGRAKQKVEDIVDILNKYQRQKNGGQSSPFVAGLYAVKEKNDNFDIALANAKLGYNRALESNVSVCICTKDIIRNEYNRVSLRSKLSQAIDNNEFEAFVQFIYGINDKKFVGGEILSRWNSSIDGFVTPAYYINDMRAVGVIGKFDYYMLEKTCKILEKWKNTEFCDLRLSCNFTRITISEEDFLQKFTAVIKKHDFDHGKLIIEITEDAFFDNSTAAYKNLAECKKMGFGVAIDDFGAGSSSVSDLAEYPVDIIKIDRQIIKKSATKRGEALIEGLSNLAHNLGMQVLCEGVETAEQDKVVRDGAADYIQGYYYSYVFPIEESENYYRKRELMNTVSE